MINFDIILDINRKNSRKIMKRTNLIFIVIWMVSILANLLFLIDYYNRPTYRLGKLKKDINIDSFGSTKTNPFLLPKGMVIMDDSPRGIASAGLFRPDRITFSIMIDRDLVDYSQSSYLDYHESLYEHSSVRRKCNGVK